MKEFFLSAWRSGFRSRSFIAVLILGFALVFIAFLSAQFSPRQPKTVALDVGFSSLRVCLVLLALFWVQEFLGKEIDRRTILFSLAYPTSRSAYLWGRYLGVLALSAVAAVCLALLLLVAVLVSGGAYDQEFPVALGLPYWSVIGGLWLDAAVVAAFALLISTLSTVPSLPLALGVGFAIAGKALGPTFEFLAKGEDPVLSARYGPIVDAIRWLLPDLSRLDWRPWPMYSLTAPLPEIGIGMLMASGYIVALMALAVRVLDSREFA